MTENSPVLYIVIPCYNEEAVLPVTAPLFLEKLSALVNKGEISKESRVLFVDDGSSDGTWEIIKKLSEENSAFCGVSQSRNRGHQNALIAGLGEAAGRCDITITIDCDGQDDINAMDDMIAAYKDGCDVVYGVRKERKTDTFFKRWSAETFYKLINSLGGEVVFNHSDYRLMSSRAVEGLLSFKEVNLFLRGMVPLVGFKSTSVFYDRQERMAGKSHYPLAKMAAFALDGITSLSTKPIRFITILGALVSIISIIAIIWVFVIHSIGDTVWGWSSMVCAIFFMGGVQLFSIGVIGEYVGKIYLETKQRPRVILKDKTGFPEEND
ncbi:MAG: glycosyltransferase family 2 protein [Lachnospiraceae bacterium]|nr:glycosyltransferase family 2 protein [Lachnospiraceae bacterium]